MTNLIGNAVKFTESGWVKVSMIAHESGVRVTVTDTGIGIKANQIERVFESFTQEDWSTTRRFGGTGLGLSIARQLVTLMGGEITVSSVEGEGSEFAVVLPLQVLDPVVTDQSCVGRSIFVDATNPVLQVTLADVSRILGMNPVSEREAQVRIEERDGCLLVTSPAERPEETQRLANTVSGRTLRQAVVRLLRLMPEVGVVSSRTEGPVSKARVLLAEDNVVNRKVAMRQLERLGIRCDVAVNGLEAVEMMEKTHYDLVFMDVQMPELDGLQATRAIRERELRLGRTTVIVAMTAHAMQGDREKCLEAGMDDYMTKPIQVEELEERLNTWLPQEERAAAAVSGQLDFLYLQEISGGDLEFEKELVAMYVDTAPVTLQELRAALGADDAHAVMHAAHSLKGSSRSIGAKEVAHILEVIEHSARNGDLDPGRGRLADLENNFDSLLREATGFCADQAA